MMNESQQSSELDSKPLYLNSDAKKLEYNFIFEGTEESSQLKCIIFSKKKSPITSHLMEGIVCFLALHQIACDSSNKSLDNEDEWHILFACQLNSDSNEILKFINFLVGLGLEEAYQNPFSLWFYVSNGGDQILNVKNYPLELIDFFDQEKAQVNSILKDTTKKYSTLIEVGCGTMENIQLAIDNNLNYYGIDFSPKPILEAREEIKKNGIKNAVVQCLNVINLDKGELSLKANEQPVFFFPFNLLGNIAPISKLLASFKSFGFDMIFSIYKTDAAINKIRLDYYANCGYKNIVEEKYLHGVAFKSGEGLYTIAYEKNYLAALIKSFGFNLTILEGDYGTAFYAWLILPLLITNEPVSVGKSAESSHDIKAAYKAGLSALYFNKNYGRDAVKNAHVHESENKNEPLSLTQTL